MSEEKSISIHPSYQESKGAKSYGSKILIKITNRSKYKRMHFYGDFFSSGRFHVEDHKAFWINPKCHHWFWVRKTNGSWAGLSGAVSYKVDYIGETKQSDYPKYVVFAFSDPAIAGSQKCETFQGKNMLKKGWDKMNGN
eukprot:201714_1